MFYIFNFTSDTEKKDLLELMEDKSEYTFFADTAKDPFTFGNPEIYEKMIPLSSVKEEKVEKRGIKMDRQVENFLKLMEKLGSEDFVIPEHFEYDTPDEEVVYEWSDIEEEVV